MSNRQSAPEEPAALAKACRDLLLRGREQRGREMEDIAQDACVRALGLEQPEAVRDPVRYLMRVARNLFIDGRRRRQREMAVIRLLGETGSKAEVAFDPERILAGKQQLESVLAAIEALPPRCREAFTLHRFQGLSYAAIARRMGVRAGTVEKHIAEAMLKLARALPGTGRGEP